MKIIVGMSGGVDSAVVAQKLKNEGHEVIGVFMRNWDSFVNNDVLGNPNANASVCPEEVDWADVQTLGKQIGIPVERVDFVSQYWENVFQDLIKQYEGGRTPNPDVLCNKYIKFGEFFTWVEKKYPDFDYIATGHYAKVENGILTKPVDAWKDQSYFLAQIDKKKLKKTMFPLWAMKKTEVREFAKDNNLIVANKKDSTGICFIGERDFTDFLRNYIPAQKGDVISISTGKVIGSHVGAMYYTIGQRKGLNLGGQSEPHYVAGHDLSKKIIFVAPQSDKSYLISTKSIITDVNWLVDNTNGLLEVDVKFRYKSPSIKCSIKILDNGDVELLYPEGFEAVTPGQQAVFYDDDTCLGGGIIDRVFDESGEKKYIY